MQIIDDLISDLNFNTPVKDIRQGIFHTGAMWTLPKEIIGTLAASAESKRDQISLTVATIDDVPIAYRDKLIPCSR